MLKKIEMDTIQFKQKLINLGIELPPATVIHNNKFKQIDMDYKQMSTVCLGKYDTNIFKNASNVFLKCTATYYIIRNLSDLRNALTQSLVYISKY